MIINTTNIRITSLTCDILLKDLLETVEQYGLASPFEEDSVRNSAELIRDIVKKYEGM